LIRIHDLHVDRHWLVAIEEVLSSPIRPEGFSRSSVFFFASASPTGSCNFNQPRQSLDTDDCFYFDILGGRHGRNKIPQPN